MKVALLSPYSLGASSCKRLYYLSRHLKVHRKLFLLAEDKYGMTKREHWFVYTARKRNDRKYPAYVLKVLKLLIRERPDIIHYSKPHHMTLIPALLYKKLFPCKLVFDCDDWEPLVQKELAADRRKLRVVEHLTEMAIETADAIVIPNTKMRREIPEKYRGRIYLIPNGVDTEKFRPMRSHEHDAFNVTYMGTIHKIDTITPLVDAIALAAKKIPELVCTVVGGGKGEHELKRMILEKDLPQQFKLLGMQPHDKIPRLLADADVLILPYSKLESLEYASNLKFFEYMALEKPIVAGAVGDIPLILEQGKAGYLARPNDPHALAEKLKEVYDHPIEAMRKAEKARALAVAYYDWDVLSKKLQAVYDDLLYIDI